MIWVVAGTSRRAGTNDVSTLNGQVLRIRQRASGKKLGNRPEQAETALTPSPTLKKGGEHSATPEIKKKREANDFAPRSQVGYIEDHDPVLGLESVDSKEARAC